VVGGNISRSSPADALASLVFYFGTKDERGRFPKYENTLEVKDLVAQYGERIGAEGREPDR